MTIVYEQNTMSKASSIKRIQTIIIIFSDHNGITLASDIREIWQMVSIFAIS